MERWLKSGTLKRYSANVEIQPASSTACTSNQHYDLQTQGDQCAVTDSGVLIIDNTINKTKNIRPLQKKRKYSDDYMKYGFSFMGDEDNPKPLCVICGETLSNGSLKPSLLMRHLETKHPSYKQKDVSFFQRLSNGSSVYFVSDVCEPTQ
ncbi:UNVERIFIED_CONTAM: hypothetical protein RMT77_011061 [Armadillidium vulgare]